MNMGNNQVDMVNVNRLIKALKLAPERICLRFQTRNGMPAIKVLLTYASGIREEFGTLANPSLINAVHRAIIFDMLPLEEFLQRGERTITDERENFELDMFKEYVTSTLPMTIREDFVTSKGERYAQVVFTTLNPQGIIYFCIKQTEEIENLLYQRKAE